MLIYPHRRRRHRLMGALFRRLTFYDPRFASAAAYLEEININRHYRPTSA